MGNKMIDNFSLNELEIIVKELRESGYFSTHVYKKTVVDEALKTAGLSDLSQKISKLILDIADVAVNNYEEKREWSSKLKDYHTVSRKRSYVPLEIESEYRSVVQSIVTAIKPYVEKQRI